MPKLPTFQADQTISQQTGTTTNVQIPLTQTLGTALKPVTDFVVKKQIQEKNFENRTEALKLENDFITDMQKVNDEVNVLENKEQANAIYKEKSNALISSYGEKASNQNVKTLFTNSALGEVQKGLFRVDTQISKNIINSLNNAVSQKENRLWNVIKTTVEHVLDHSKNKRNRIWYVFLFGFGCGDSVVF